MGFAQLQQGFGSLTSRAQGLGPVRSKASRVEPLVCKAQAIGVSALTLGKLRLLGFRV